LEDVHQDVSLFDLLTEPSEFVVNFCQQVA